MVFFWYNCKFYHWKVNTLVPSFLREWEKMCYRYSKPHWPMGSQGLIENLGKTYVLNAGLTYGYVPAAVILAQRKSDYQKIGGYLPSTVPYNLWPFKSCKEKGSHNWMKWSVAESVERMELFSMSHEFPQLKKWLPKNRRLLTKHYRCLITCVSCKEKLSHNWMKWIIERSKEGIGFFPLSHE